MLAMLTTQTIKYLITCTINTNYDKSGKLAFVTTTKSIL